MIVNSIILRDSGGGITWKKELSNLDLEGINSQIGTILNILQDDSNSVLELACPTHDNCRFCEHRVTCIPHRELKNKLTLNQACFLSGEILKFFPLPGSKMKLTVRINGELYQTIVAKNSISFNSDELPLNAEFHAFYLDSRRPRQLNARKESYRVIKS